MNSPAQVLCFLGRFDGYSIEFLLPAVSRAGSTGRGMSTVPRSPGPRTDAGVNIEFGCVAGSPFDVCGIESARDPRGIEAALRRADGHFSAALVAPDGLVLATDVLGAGHLYYTVRDGHLLFASHLGLLLTLVDRPPVLVTETALSVLAASGLWRDLTPFDGIRRLPAGGYLAAPMNGTAPAWPAVARYLSLQDLADQYRLSPFDPTTLNEALATSVAGAVTVEDTCLMLSGGRDSGIIALNAPGRLTRAVSCGAKHSVDVIVARNRARRLGLVHRVVPYEDWTLSTYAEHTARLHAGTSGLETSHIVVAFEAASRFARRAVVGYLGDALTGGHLPRSGALAFDDVVRLALPNLERLSQFAEIADTTASLRTLWDELRGASPVQRFMMTDLLVRQAGWISQTFDLCRWFLDISFPFFRKEIIGRLLNATHEQLVTRSLYDSAIAERARARGTGLRDRMPPRGLRRYVPMLEVYARAGLHGQVPSSRLDWRTVLRRTPRDMLMTRCGTDWLDALNNAAATAPVRAAEKSPPFVCATAALCHGVRAFADRDEARTLPLPSNGSRKGRESAPA